MIENLRTLIIEIMKSKRADEEELRNDMKLIIRELNTTYKAKCEEIQISMQYKETIDMQQEEMITLKKNFNSIKRSIILENLLKKKVEDEIRKNLEFKNRNCKF